MFEFIQQQLLNAENVKFYTDVISLEIDEGTNVVGPVKKIAFDVLNILFFYLFMCLVGLSCIFHKMDSETGNCRLDYCPED